MELKNLQDIPYSTWLLVVGSHKWDSACRKEEHMITLWAGDPSLRQSRLFVEVMARLLIDTGHKWEGWYSLPHLL